MIKLSSDQAEASQAFRKWASAMTAASTLKNYGWVVEGKGLVFSNYGHGGHGEIEDQVMLGVDPDARSGTVKIVEPDVSRGAKGKLTLVGRNESGRLFLLREGRLTGNRISRLVRDDFTELSGLESTPVLTASGEPSDRNWFVVADLGVPPSEIVSQTVNFALACARARVRAGGGAASILEQHPGFGMDESGGIMTVTKVGGTAEVVRLQGHVYQQLRKAVGSALSKPMKGGFCVDAMVNRANLLIEIKTSVSAQSIYEAVGQLLLYPSLIGLPRDVSRAMLLPDHPLIKPSMAAAIEDAGLEVYTYSIGGSSKKPTIGIPKALLVRCGEA